jgi:hypothetical protein
MPNTRADDDRIQVEPELATETHLKPEESAWLDGEARRQGNTARGNVVDATVEHVVATLGRNP